MLCMEQALLDDEGHTGPYVGKLRAVFRQVATVLINDVPDWEEGLKPSRGTR